MFDKYNHIFNVVVAIMLAVSPHFMQEHGLTKESAHKIMAEAEQRAQKIVESGDTAELEQISAAAGEMDKYRPVLEKLAPVIDKVAARLGVSDVMGAGLSDGMTSAEVAKATTELAALSAPEKAQ